MMYQGKNIGCFQQILGDGTPCLHMSVDLTNDGIDAFICQTLPVVLAKDIYWVCAIMGYDQDPRELCEVPEVRAFCERLVNRGFIACLHPSTLFYKKEQPELGGYLGGLEIWAMSKNMVDVKSKGGDILLTKEKAEEFIAILKLSERKALVLIHPSDGQHRTKSI
jgi:hypothetical protein